LANWRKQRASIWKPCVIMSASAWCLNLPGPLAAIGAMVPSIHGGCHLSGGRGELGFGIEDIIALLTLAEPGRGSCADVQTLTKVHLDDVRAKIADLQRLERILAKTVDQCSGTEAPICPVLDMLGDGTPLPLVSTTTSRPKS
jgi:MerR, DNA binding